MDKRFHLKLPAKHMSYVKEQAKKNNMSMADWLRRLIHSDIERGGEDKLMRALRQGY